MRTISIPQLYCGASGKKGAYNRQEVGLARAFAALGCRAVVLYPDPDAAPEAVTSEDLEPNVRIYYVPARKAGVSAFYRTWQPLLNEHVDAVHVMGDNALGVPGLYRFCRDHDIFFYSQLGAIKSTSENPVMRAVMDLLCRRNLAIYRKTPTYAKTPAVAAQLEHARLKGDAGAGGVLLKDHGQGLAMEIVVDDAVLLVIFQLVRRVQDVQNVLLGQVQQL